MSTEVHWSKYVSVKLLYLNKSSDFHLEIILLLNILGAGNCMNMELPQAMGQSASNAMKMLPKFVYDGGSPTRFMRDFPLVAKFFGVAEVFLWDDDKRLEPEEDRLNTVALTVLRQYVSESVLMVIMVGNPGRASQL